MAIFFAAEEVKKKLSVLQKATVFVEFAGGRKTFTFTRADAAKVWKSLFENFRKCVLDGLERSKIEASTITHLLLVGGSSRIPKLPDALAESLSRPVSDVIVCTKSERIVSSGASQQAYFQDEASQALESGLGFRIFDREANTYRNLLFLAPGHIVPAEGLFFERGGFAIARTNGSQNLLCEPFVCKHEVRASITEGRNTFLQDSETLLLEDVQTSLEDFPSGEHSVSLGLKLGAGLTPRLLARPTSMPDIEPLSIPLSLAHRNGTKRYQVYCGWDILLLLDLSKSMRGQKLYMLQEGASNFADTAFAKGAEMAIAAFGGCDDQAARLLVPFGAERAIYKQKLAGLHAHSGTFMAEGLSLALQVLKERNNELRPVVIMFTDGMPASMNAAEAAANELKEHAVLACTGIGEDVLQPFLQKLASYPDFYRYAEGPHDIFHQFVSIAELLWQSPSDEYEAEEDWDYVDDEDEN